MSVEKTDMKKIQFSVPEGYFQKLQGRLEAIPEKSAEMKPSRWNVVKPYLAMAAAFAMILTGGTAVLKMTTDKVVDTKMSDYDEIRMADLVPVTEPYLVYLNKSGESDITDEDITAYLIDSGMSLDHISYYESK